MRRSIVCLGALALAACNSADDGPKTAEQAAEEMGEAPKMRAGLWTTTVEVTRFDMPGAPPEAKNMMQGMMGQGQSSEQCVSAEEANRDPREFLKESQQGNCTFGKFSVAGGAVDAQMTCKPEQGAEANVTMKGQIAPERVTMAIESAVTGAAAPGQPGNMTMAMTMTSVRTGDCPAGGTN